MPANFKEISSFVPQDDVLMPGLTPREMLGFTAALTLESGKAARTARVRAVLRKLNIEVCADTLIGDVDKKGEFAVHVSLAASPPNAWLPTHDRHLWRTTEARQHRDGASARPEADTLSVFDKGTTGLDSKSAEDVVEAFNALAKMGRTIMVTIHQPSRKIFDSFDGVGKLRTCRPWQAARVCWPYKRFSSLNPKRTTTVLMAKGTIVYAGPTAACMDYFSKEGKTHTVATVTGGGSL
eukprot:scaffold2771_cov252-Pinguiococcus_pyrenoidosus.AAC.17